MQFRNINANATSESQNSKRDSETFADINDTTISYMQYPTPIALVLSNPKLLRMPGTLHESLHRCRQHLPQRVVKKVLLLVRLESSFVRQEGVQGNLKRGRIPSILITV